MTVVRPLICFVIVTNYVAMLGSRCQVADEVS